MYRTALFIRTLSPVAAATASADGLTFTTDPADGVLTGTAGTTVGWGFTITTPDSNYYALTSVQFCFGAQAPTCPTSTAVGVFSDIAAYQESDSIGPDYSTSPYTELYSPGATGLGEFAIDPSAAPQDLVGTLYVYYDEYAADPSLGGDAFFSGQATSTAEVDIVAPAPEPSTAWLMLAAGLVIGVGRVLPIRNRRAAGNCRGSRSAEARLWV